MNEGYGQPNKALGSVGHGGIAGQTATQQTINDQLINARAGLQELLQKLNAISARAGTNRANMPTPEVKHEPHPESNAMCDVANDINELVLQAHRVVGEIQSIV